MYDTEPSRPSGINQRLQVSSQHCCRVYNHRPSSQAGVLSA